MIEQISNDLSDFFSNQLNKNSPLNIDQFWNDYKDFYHPAPINEEGKNNFKKRFKSIVEHEFLKPTFIDPDCNEVLVYSNKFLHTEKKGKLFEVKIFDLSPSEFHNSLNFLAQKNHITWNYSNPFASFYAKLFNFEVRVTLIHSSLTSNFTSKTSIRKIRNKKLTFKDFHLSSTLENKIKFMIEEKKNILIAGSTSSGKTSFLGCLIDKIPKSEHILILEDTHELKSEHYSHTNLLSREDKVNFELKNLLAYSLRMRPDRILLGEIRSKEVVPFILAMNTGHNGLMGTLHANSPNEALTRMALLFTLYSENNKIAYGLIMKIICQNIDSVIYLEERKVKSIIKVLGSEDGIPYYENIT